MRRYWVEPEARQDQNIVLEGDVFHHICTVCRQQEGDRFELILAGKAFLVEITTIEKKKAFTQILEEREIAKRPKPEIHLALSLPKFQTVDRVVEKMVELGVEKVHLFHSDFSFKKPKPEELKNKWSRWQKIIQGATQQSGRGDLMELTEIQPLSVLLERNFPDKSRWGVLAYEGEGTLSMADRLKGLDDKGQEAWIFVGSEGGFSESDLKLFGNYNLLPVTLGEQVLRVETACVTLVSILKYGLGHFD